jgi:hypothetical protein
LKNKREELKARRNLLFRVYTEHPDDIRMSLEIKGIDDQIADLAEQARAGNRGFPENGRSSTQKPWSPPPAAK